MYLILVALGLAVLTSFLNKKKAKARPSTPKLYLEYFMKNVKLTWTLPTTRVDGRALDPLEIKHTVIYVSLDGGLNYVELATILGTATQELVQTELDSGTYHFRAVVYDFFNSASAPAHASVDIPFAAPAAVTNFVVTIL